MRYRDSRLPTLKKSHLEPLGRAVYRLRSNFFTPFARSSRTYVQGDQLRFDIRVGDDVADLVRAHAGEVVGVGPDVIVVESVAATRAVLERSRTIPVVFFNVGEPGAGGLLKNIARPEGNATGI